MEPARQGGNALIMILIAVALFAALSYAFMQGSRTSTGWVSDEQAKSHVQQIMAVGNDVKNAAKRMQLRGCKDSQISFYTVEGFGANTTAPADKSCHVFEVNGGGLRYAHPSTNAFTTTGFNMGPSMVKVNNIGTNTATDIIWSFWYLKKDICVKLNNALGITNPGGNPPVDSLVAAQWDTNWADGINDSLAIGLGDNATQISGKTAFCYEQTPGLYEYVQVLIAR